MSQPPQFDLFQEGQQSPETRHESSKPPLAYRMRPQTLEEFQGQERILGRDKPLWQWIQFDRVPSLIFWGPPGCGKTTLSQIIAEKTSAHFKSMSAVLCGIKEIKEAIAHAIHLLNTQNRKTILFIDEIHRFNKAQQDALLPHVENGSIIFIGATTENPSFEINSALLSRVRVVHFDLLSVEAIVQILEKALIDSARGLGGFLSMTREAIQHLAALAQGDARRALTALEIVALHFRKNPQPAVNVEDVRKALESTSEHQPILYDSSGEEHYNVISAFIKSIRDSDPHAGLYYLARMIEGGEDPLFIARRLVILASEDIGNADPRALQVAIAVKEAVHFLGMPEGRIPLAQAVTYLALAPKSNASYQGIKEALEEVRKSGALPTPLHLRNAVTALMKAEGYGKNYFYAHQDPQGESQQTHLPEKLLGSCFYRPKELGLEKQLKEKLDRMNKNFLLRRNS